MLLRAITIAFIVGTVTHSQAQWAAPLRPILEALDEAKLSGSLELSGGCRSFPQSRTPATTKGPTIQKIREILADDPTMHVTQDGSGTVRMVETGVPDDLLNVKISHLTFEDYGHHAVFTPNAALNFIFRAPEMVAFVGKHDIELPSGGGVQGNIASWPPELPHISGSLDNVTLSHALDHVLKTFPGLWVYWSCPQSDHKTQVYFQFFSIKKVGGRVFINEG